MTSPRPWVAPQVQTLRAVATAESGKICGPTESQAFNPSITAPSGCA